jgi:hypothetical protein
VTSAMALSPSGSSSQTLSLLECAGGEPTLDDVLSGVWEGLAARATVPCPICGERMEPVVGAPGERGGAPQAPRTPRERAGAPQGPRTPREREAEGARCTSCGSSLT